MTIALALAPGGAGAVTSFLPPLDLLLACSRAAVTGHYAQAREVAAGLRTQSPGLYDAQAWADLLEAHILLAEMGDTGDWSSEARYLAHYKRSRETFRRKAAAARSDPEAAAAWFAMSKLETGEAARLKEQHQTVGMLAAARRTVACLKKVKRLDASLPDADLGMAVADYGEGRLLGWTGLTARKRRRAVDRVRAVAEMQTYSRYEAGLALVWILLDDRKYQEAAEGADRWLAELGDNRAFLDPAALAWLRCGDLEKAGNRYARFLELLRQMPVRNLKREFRVTHRLADIAQRRGDWGEAATLAAQALALPRPETVSERHARAIEALRQLQQRASEHTGNG